jgi:hypothetical protein
METVYSDGWHPAFSLLWLKPRKDNLTANDHLYIQRRLILQDLNLFLLGVLYKNTALHRVASA